MLVGGLSYHEFSTEKRLETALGPKWQGKLELSDLVERGVYLTIPIVLFAGWWVTQRSLRSLSELARSVRRFRFDNLGDPLPRSGNRDEVDQLTEAFNYLSARLDQSFQQIRGSALHASHELKTPLTVMRAEVESMLESGEPLTPPQREHLYSMYDEINRLTRIVGALTFLAKADAGQLNLKLEYLPLAEIVRETYEDALILAEAQELRIALTDCADVVVWGDRDRLRQLLVNLADNAVKYNYANGAVEIALRQRGSSAEIEIVNTGAGIPLELQPRVFDRFVRGREGPDRGIEGCGLGLSIAQSIVQAHRGTIQIVSEPGKTTTVRVQLPITVPRDHDAAISDVRGAGFPACGFGRLSCRP